MVSKEIVTVLCGLGLCLSAAVAEPAPPPPMGHGDGMQPPMKQMSQADMQKMHARMCLAGYAREVGHISQLKVELQLKSSQESAFDAWKSVKLKAAAAHKDDCMAMKLPEMAGKPGMKPGEMGPKPDMVKGMEMEEKHLESRLKDLRAEMPALKSLWASLSDDQKAAFMPPMGPKPGPDHGPHGAPEGAPHGGPHGPQGGPDKP